MAGRVMLVVGALTASGATVVALGWRTAAAARLARTLLAIAASALAASLAALAIALVTGDFALVYVADHSRRGASAWYRLAGLWGGMEGSLLLWTALLAAVGSLAAWRTTARRTRPADPGGTGAVDRVGVAVLGLMVAGFAATTALTADPFRTLQIPATDGGGLVPILEHPAMLIHPPLLYLGLVSTVVPFALTVAALLTRHLDAAWRTTCRRWLLLTWILLIAGLATGSNWAYVELGWGGYWAWDPIENTALLPWLAVTAALHQFLVRPVRAGPDGPIAAPVPSAADATLPLLGWVLAVLGTLLTRSGAAVSVHAFAESDAVVVALFATWLTVAVIAVVAVVVGLRRARRTTTSPDVDLASAGGAAARAGAGGVGGVGVGVGIGIGVGVERIRIDRAGLLRSQTVLVLGAVVLVGAGTVTPVVRAQLGGPPSATTGDYFAAATAPLVWLALVLMAIAPALRGDEPLRWSALEPLLRIPVLVGLAVAAVLATQGWTELRTLVTGGLAAMAAASAILRLVARRGGGPGRAGSHVAHLGFAVLLLGFAGATAGSDRTVMLDPGASVVVGGVTVRNDAVRTDPGDGNPRVIASFTVERGARSRTLDAQIIGYPTAGVRLAETALWSDPTGDVQIALRTADDDGRALVDVHVRPLTPLVWWGAAIMLLGGLLAVASPRARPGRPRPAGHPPPATVDAHPPGTRTPSPSP